MFPWLQLNISVVNEGLWLSCTTYLKIKQTILYFWRGILWKPVLINNSFLLERGIRNPPQALSITAILFPSPPLFTRLSGFQFTQSALPTPLAALFPCDSCRPIAVQAHLVPCEAIACSTTSLQQQVAMATHTTTRFMCVCVGGEEESWLCQCAEFIQTQDSHCESLWIWRVKMRLS